MGLHRTNSIRRFRPFITPLGASSVKVGTRRSLSTTASPSLPRSIFLWMETRGKGRMRVSCACLCVSLMMLSSSADTVGRAEEEPDGAYSRKDFPKDFVFGSATSAYQVEGAAAEDGRTPSIWDTFCHEGKMIDNSTGDIACDGYHKFKEDIKLMAETGLEAYRFSISWSRLIPNGRGPINPLGLQFYNNFINELINHGIQPHVTLVHYDHPQALEDEYGGWLNPKIVDDFTAYADACFKEFGDRVLYWTTFNEPNVFAIGGYDFGEVPPGRCSYPFGTDCSKGNSTVEPYIVVHNCLLAHAAAAELYRTKYQAKQHGFIGLNIFVYTFLPLTNSTRDKKAARRAFDFYAGWICEPLVHGDYPKSMKDRVGIRLPSFSRAQSKQIMNSSDFLGINFYAILWVEDFENNTPANERDFMQDVSVKYTVREASPANKFNSFGIEYALEYMKLFCGNPSVYIHENGYAMPHNSQLDDAPRVEFISAFIGSVLDALRNGSNTKGYFSWSFMDVFEVLYGYQSTYGLYYVDFADKDLKRYPKLSAKWYSNFLKGKANVLRNKLPLDASLAYTE